MSLTDHRNNTTETSVTTQNKKYIFAKRVQKSHKLTALVLNGKKSAISEEWENGISSYNIIVLKISNFQQKFTKHTKKWENIVIHRKKRNLSEILTSEPRQQNYYQGC